MSTKKKSDVKKEVEKKEQLIGFQQFINGKKVVVFAKNLEDAKVQFNKLRGNSKS